MDIKIAGKCPPSAEDFANIEDKGFENVELYLEESHLDNFKEIIEYCRNTELDIVSVHTPHVTAEDKDYLKKADRLASKLDAYLVVHSQYILNIKVDQLSEIGFKSDHGFENNPGTSFWCLKNSILSKNIDLVLDTAHLFIGERNYIETFQKVLDNHKDSINLIHFNDSTKTVDGLSFGQGTLNLERLAETLYESGYSGIVVMEVMPEDQKEAKNKFEEWYTSPN